ncbi:MAG: hypothetical protein WBM90_00255 [Acidimicrobiia bacterium]
MIGRFRFGVLATLVVLGACTADGTGSSPTVESTPGTTIATTTTTTAVSAEAAEEFRSCLAEQGIDIDVIRFDAQGRPRLDLALINVDFSDPASSDAVTACSELLSTGALDLSKAPVMRTAVQALLAEFSVCVRAHGVPDFPDPVPGFGGIGAPFPAAEIPFSDPSLEEAVSTCRGRLGAEQGQ